MSEEKGNRSGGLGLLPHCSSQEKSLRRTLVNAILAPNSGKQLSLTSSPRSWAFIESSQKGVAVKIWFLLADSPSELGFNCGPRELGGLAKRSDQHIVCISDEVVKQLILQAVQGEQFENGGRCKC